nr:unnamed protein product [Spirometra erinaceieuropaei]
MSPWGSLRKGGQVGRYRDTLRASLWRLQINPANCEDLAQDRLAWRRAVKTGTAIYEANRVTDAKAKRGPRKLQLPPPRNANPKMPADVPGTNRSY